MCFEVCGITRDILRFLRNPNLMTWRLGLERFSYTYDPFLLSFFSSPYRA
jgi:hypothetical protein